MQTICDEQRLIENFNVETMIDKTIKKYVFSHHFTYEDDYEIYEAPQYENINGIWYIYCTFVQRNSTSSIKMYVQLAMGFLCFEQYYHNSNMIDIDKNYPLSDIRERLKNHLTSILKQVEG